MNTEVTSQVVSEVVSEIANNNTDITSEQYDNLILLIQNINDNVTLLTNILAFMLFITIGYILYSFIWSLIKSA